MIIIYLYVCIFSPLPTWSQSSPHPHHWAQRSPSRARCHKVLQSYTWYSHTCPGTMLWVVNNTDNRTWRAYIVMFSVGCHISNLFDRDNSPILLICEGINALIDRGKDFLGHVALEMDWLDRLGILNRVHDGKSPVYLYLRRGSSQLWHVQAQLLSILLYIVKIIELRRGWAAIFSSNNRLSVAPLIAVRWDHWSK